MSAAALAPDAYNFAYLDEQTKAMIRRAILKALLREPSGMDSLCEQTGLTAEALMAELSVMEIMGQVRRDSGNIFAVAIRTTRTE